MHRFFTAVVKPVLEAVRPKVIVEVGAAEGAHTELLLDYAIKHGSVVHVVDPKPKFESRRFAERYGASYRLHEELSLSALSRIEGPDVVLIDGDHNWYTVVNELRLLERAAREAVSVFPVTMLHDVDWPYGRRDLYYAPETIPDAYRQPYRQAGLKPGSTELSENDGLNPHLNNAIYENAVNNGVRTAVEDFLSETDSELQFIAVPGIHGLGILLPKAALDDSKKLRALAKSFGSTRFLLEQCERVERGRVEALIEQERARRGLKRARAELQELQVRASGIADELEEHRQEVEQARAAERDARQRRNTADAELETLRARSAKAEGLRAQAEEAAGLRARLEEAATLRAQLEESLREQGAKASRRRSELEVAAEERTRMEAELAEHGERLQRALREVGQAGAEHERLRAELATRDQQLESQRLGLAEAKVALEAAQRERNLFRGEADAALESAREVSRELVDREVAHARAVQQAETLRREAASELADVERALHDARSEADARTRVNADLRHELDRTVSDAREAAARVEAERDQALLTAQEREAQAARRQNDLSTAVARQVELEHELERAVEDGERRAAEAAHAHAELSLAVERRLELERAAEDGERRVAEAGAALAERQAELARTAELANRLETELAERVAELERRSDRHRGLEVELTSEQGRVRALQAELEAAVALRRKVQAESAVRREVADAKQAELEEAVALRRRVQAELRAAEAEADALRDAIWTRERRIQELLGELREFRADVERAAKSRSWRYGHGMMRFLALLTFRRRRPEGALERLVRRMDELPAGDLATLPPSRHERPSGPSEPTVQATKPPGPALDAERAETPPDLEMAWVDPADAPSGPPAAADLPAERALTSTDLLPDSGDRDREIAAFRAEAARSATESLDKNLSRAQATLASFHDRLGADWLSGARGRNERFFEALGASRLRPPPRVMVGTLESGEVELETCKRAIGRQTYGELEHVVIGGLPKQAAVAALMERFLASDFDVLVKVDGDVVLLDDTFVDRAVGVLRANEGVDMAQMAILDYFSGGPVQGVNAYRRGIDWHTDRQHPLFTDRTGIAKDRRLVVWAPFVRGAIHSPDPSPFQAFHFGVHRGMKVLQPGNSGFNQDQAAEQTMYLERTWEHFLVRRDPRLGFACLGYELAVAGEFEIPDLDYTSPSLRKSFGRYEELDSGGVKSLVEELRDAPSKAPQAETVRRDRRRILWRSTADIESIVMVLPHFGVFGGVNRFFELARCLRDLGVECVLARPQDEALFHGKNKLVVDRPDYPEVETITFEEALARSWDVALCGDCTSGVMLTLPLFEARITAAYLLNGWMHREANARQIRLTAPEVVIANSSYAARFYEDFAPAVVPGGINLSVFKPPAGGERAGAATNGGSPESHAFRVLAYAGRSKPAKRFEDVVEACRELHDAGVAVELNVYDQSSIELDVPFEWRFHGGLLRHQVRDLMWEMDAMLSAERDAGWSNPTAEAMACGVPLVCTEAGTVDFALDEETALVVPTGRPDLIATAARRLWEDPALGRSLSVAGLERIAGFGWPGAARELLDLFRDVRRDGMRRRRLNQKASAAVEELVAGVPG